MLNSTAVNEATPLFGSLQHAVVENRSFSDLLRELKTLIEQHELSPLDGGQSHDGQTQSSCLHAILEKIEKFILFNRACSCSFRFKSTNHAGLELFQIARQSTKITSIISTACALSFFLTDAGITVSTTKNSVKMLKNLFGEVKAILNSLRDNTGGLPLLRIIILFALLPGGMWGAFNKGFVGIKSIAELIASFVTSDVPDKVDILFQLIGYIVGASSALCFAAFNMRNGLGILRTTRALFAGELWSEYMKTKKATVYFDQVVTFLISVAMTLITLLATFYVKGSFALTWQATIEASFIGLSNLTLNTIYTTGPNYILKTIKAQYNALAPQSALVPFSCCDRVGAMGLQTIGVISSLGNSVALLPAIFFIMTLASKEQDLTKQNISTLVIALIAWLLLAVPMFLRDYAYYTKPLLEWFEKRHMQRNVVSDERLISQEQNQSSVCQSVCSFFRCCFSKDSSNDDINNRLDLNFA